MYKLRATILAAGRGSRLGSITDNLPKTLLPIGENNFFEQQLAIYKKLNFDEISVVTGYLKESFIKYRGIKQIVNQHWFETNMLTSLLVSYEKNESRIDVVSYGDLIFEETAILKMLDSPFDISLLYDLNFLNYWKKRFKDPLCDLEDFKISTDGKLLEIGTKPNAIESINGQYMGIFKITPKGWQLIFEFIKSEDIQILNNISMTEFWNRFISRGGSVYGIPYSGKWSEIDTLNDLKLAHEMFPI